jgi:hypothetical protein
MRLKIVHLLLLIAATALALWAWRVLPEWWLVTQSMRRLEG